MTGRTLPPLPQLLHRKIYKTGQTRGADDDVIFQNRVARSSTVLIPYNCLSHYSHLPRWEAQFENGAIILLSPSDYFSGPDTATKLNVQGLEVGKNALVFYETREQWNRNNPDTLGWSAATSRLAPLGGQYVARISATTSNENGARINRGFTATSMKGAGIRAYEYADSKTIANCRLQLEALFWLCNDADAVAVSFLMSQEDVESRKDYILKQCEIDGLLDIQRLVNSRVLNSQGHSICPLCLEELSGIGFLSRLSQAEGREVHDLTVTQVNLFHIQELRYGVFNHRPYNIGWGHHHCNVVAKDSGIDETLNWMESVLNRNKAAGYLTPTAGANSGS